MIEDDWYWRVWTNGYLFCCFSRHGGFWKSSVVKVSDFVRLNNIGQSCNGLHMFVIYQFLLSAHLCCALTLLWFLLWFSLLFHLFYSYLNSILQFTLWIILIFLSYLCPYSDIHTIWLFSYLCYYDTSLLCFRLSHSVLSPNFYLTNCKVLLRLQFVN